MAFLLRHYYQRFPAAQVWSLSSKGAVQKLQASSQGSSNIPEVCVEEWVWIKFQEDFP